MPPALNKFPFNKFSALHSHALGILEDGPVKTLPASPKRIRCRLDGVVIADTTSALYVWEHARYPTYYLPLDAFAPGVLNYTQAQKITLEDDEDDGYAFSLLTSPNPSPESNPNPNPESEPDTSKIATIFLHSALRARYPHIPQSPNTEPLLNHVRLDFSAVEWYEEDSRITIHPKDPFKRIDVVFSSRPIRILISGIEIASSPSSFHLYETGLPVRFYLPPTSVDGRFLKASKTESGEATVTGCPYKGEAGYYDVVLGGGGEEERLKDVAWYYTNPKPECAAIAGCLCFYNEKVDIELDGVMLERPKPYSVIDEQVEGGDQCYFLKGTGHFMSRYVLNIV
ncbi:DUF427-domain-containing protein [Astrocystis sublimbata]|nr:DUF427-domain-containing protein [Astrocystis sublimbata]